MKLQQIIHRIVFAVNLSYRYGRGGPKLTVVFALLVLALPISRPANGSNALPFEKLYDYYFPKYGEFVNNRYRRGFDERLFGRPPAPGSERHPIYRAFRGDPDAFHAFVHHSDRDQPGEYGEAWANECVLLLLRLGDERFAELLVLEDRKTRETIGQVIDSTINWDKHKFPKTRRLYSYRWVPLSQGDILKRQKGPILAAAVTVTSNQLIRLKAALEVDSRFNEVGVYGTARNGKAPALITVPKTLSRNDMADLRRLIQDRLQSKRPIVFK